MQVEIGKDGLQFESRSFSHFGSEALLNIASGKQSNSRPHYIPDFTVRLATDCQILIVTWWQYLAASKATCFEKEGHTRNGSKPDVFTEEWEIAESTELQQTTGNSVSTGLSPITKLLPKKPTQGRKTKKQHSLDQRHLLESGSSCSSASGSPLHPRSLSRENSPFNLEGVDGGDRAVNGETVLLEMGQDWSREGATTPDRWTTFNSTKV